MGKKYISPNDLAANHQRFQESLQVTKRNAKEIIEAFKNKEISFQQAMNFLDNEMNSIKETYETLYGVRKE